MPDEKYDPNALPVEWTNVVHSDDDAVTLAPDQTPRHDAEDA